MLDIKFIREQKEFIKEVLRKRKTKFDLDAFLAQDDKRLEILKNVEHLRSEQNQVSNRIASNHTKDAERAQLISEMRGLKEELKKSEDDLNEIMKEWQKDMLVIPNIPSADTPEGPDESGNKVLRTWGEKPAFSFVPKDHEEIGKALGIIDTDTAAIVTGSRFSYLKGDLVKMQFGLIQMCFELLTDDEKLTQIAKEANVNVKIKSFIPIIPPVFVRPLIQVKMARFLTPEEHYVFPEDDQMLVGSAEHTLGPIHMDHIFKEEDLPIRYAGYSTAFRREAGAAGKDTAGILRQHQFDKIEMETFSLPEHSTEEQNFLVAIQEHLLRELKLPYEVMIVCTGDMGFPDNRQIDINTWMPGQDRYRETHSADSTGGFQARRLNTRVRRSDGKLEPVHMNDATAFAIGRTLIAIIENYQQEDGSVRVPDVLVPYVGKEVIKHRS